MMTVNLLISGTRFPVLLLIFLAEHVELINVPGPRLRYRLTSLVGRITATWTYLLHIQQCHHVGSSWYSPFTAVV